MAQAAMTMWEMEEDPDLANEPVLMLDMQVSHHTRGVGGGHLAFPLHPKGSK